MKEYKPGEDKEVYTKCIGIARSVDNFSCSIVGDKILLKAGDPIRATTMDTALFFKMDANEIINMLNKGVTQ